MRGALHASDKLRPAGLRARRTALWRPHRAPV